MIGSGKPKLLQEETLFSEEMMGEGLYREFQEMQELSKEMYEQIDKFLTNHFQSFAAAKIAAADRGITVASIPSGSGKTYIAALLAKYYQKRDKKVAIVTTEEFLVT